MENLIETVRSARGGDVEAFGRLVRAFQAMALGYAYALLGDFERAEDAAQEAFLQAWRDLVCLEEPKAFPGWFRTIVFRQCRRQVRGPAPPTVPLEEATQMDEGRPSPRERAEHGELVETVLAAIRDLPEAERTATTLYYIDGYSQEEVGAFLDVPVGTVKSRLHAARKRLRKRMTQMVEETLKQHEPGDAFTRKVLAAVVERYGLATDAHIVAEAKAPKAVYDERHLRMEAGGELYLLQQHAWYLSEEDLRAQRRFAGLMQDVGFPIVAPADPVGGTDHPSLEDKAFTLFPFEEGRPLGVDTVDDLRIAAELQGEWIACVERLGTHPEWQALVSMARRLRPRGWTRVVALDRIIDYPRETGIFEQARQDCAGAIPEPLQAEFLDSVSRLESTVGDLDRVFAERGLRDLPHTVVHGWLSANYIRLVGERPVVSPDLYCATYDLRLADFARMVDFAERSEEWVDLTAADRADLFSRFQVRAQLSPAEIRALPYLMAANCLWYEIGHVWLCLHEEGLDYKQQMTRSISHAVDAARAYLREPGRVLAAFTGVG